MMHAPLCPDVGPCQALTSGPVAQVCLPKAQQFTADPSKWVLMWELAFRNGLEAPCSSATYAHIVSHA